ncbi:hypothetical protein GRI55_10050 [Erythrobacter citreus]|uniref:Uncharacterized protein n=1 Tax=Qipengyuania citrea TaxID=225971 RepID=A0A6I4UB01_9SPHN|nr:hypothetical protein [Qipengyuania citrea]MDQ0564865.1 hypothetical protein [Qipengyuania citrea]MXP36112.1 hypothetical protein [Qipengyuania citrea]
MAGPLIEAPTLGGIGNFTIRLDANLAADTLKNPGGAWMHGGVVRTVFSAQLRNQGKLLHFTSAIRIAVLLQCFFYGFHGRD